MSENRESSDRTKALLVLIATAGTVVFNGLAAAGYVNGVTPGIVSAKYPTVVSPADYAFTIWTLIGAGLIAFGVYQFLPSNIERFRGVRSVYIWSCVLNCAWIFFWHREMIAFCLVIILGLFATLLIINLKLEFAETSREMLLTKAPFGLYFGWITAV